MTASAQFNPSEVSKPTAGDNHAGVTPDHVANLYSEPGSFNQSLKDSQSTASVDHVVGHVTLVDDKSSEGQAAHPAKTFWQRLTDAFAAEAYAEAGMVPPSDDNQGQASGQSADNKPGANGAVEAPPAQSKPQINLGDLNARSEHAGPTQTNGDSTVRLGETPTLHSPETGHPAEAPHAASGAHSAPEVRLHPEAGTHNPEVAKHAPEATAPARPGQENLNALLPSVLKNVGKPVQELEPGINPRLGCVRMLSHAMHEADPSFPETNNTAAFRRALKEHGYEAVTVKPGDPAINQSQPGDVVVGSRPDGMPSHVALNMGDGAIFNNNSDTGKGQIDKLSQFNQGMHDKEGHFNKDGFQSVTIYRKHAPAAAAA